MTDPPGFSSSTSSPALPIPAYFATEQGAALQSGSPSASKPSDVVAHDPRYVDAIVFTQTRGAGLPIAWNLAGGDQEPHSRVLDIYARTMAACVAAWR